MPTPIHEEHRFRVERILESPAIEHIQKGFLGTPWAFVVLHSGTRLWVNEKTGTIVPIQRADGDQ